MKFGLNSLLCFIAGVLFVILGVLALIMGKHILLADACLGMGLFCFVWVWLFKEDEK